MPRGFRITFETFDVDNPDKTLDRSLIMEENITKPTNCLDFSLSHEKQMELIQSTLDKVIAEKTALINIDRMCCPNCSGVTLLSLANTRQSSVTFLQTTKLRYDD